MSRTSFIIIFIFGGVVSVLLLMRGVSSFVFIGIGFLIVFPVALCIVTIELKQTTNILEKQCDPARFLEKSSTICKLPDINKALCLWLLGRYEDCYNLLQTIEPRKRRGIASGISYHVMLMSYYLEKDDMDNAATEYTNLKKLRRRNLLPLYNMSIDLSVAEYHYKLNVTNDTTKYFLEQVRYLYSTYAKKLSLRQKLAFKYTEAELLEKLGDIEGALFLYGKIAEVGNTLHMAEISRKKLLELKTETGQFYE